MEIIASKYHILVAGCTLIHWIVSDPEDTSKEQPASQIPPKLSKQKKEKPKIFGSATGIFLSSLRYSNSQTLIDGLDILLQPGPKPGLSTMVPTFDQYPPPSKPHIVPLSTLKIPPILKDVPQHLLVDQDVSHYPLGSRQRELVAYAEYYQTERGICTSLKALNK